MAAYYNELDPFAAAWLRELIKAGQIADGEVDERSIADVRPDDLRGFTQCHFFAGIGGWSLALRLAGWPDDRHVWTGSCPCQPFSSAGQGVGGDDPRHLWPTWFRLIAECRPAVVFGEQVESAVNHGWFDLVCDDLEREGYAAGAASLPAASVGAFHIRQRLWFVADSHGSRRGSWRAGEAGDGHDAARFQPSGLCVAGDVAESDRGQRERVADGEGRERDWTQAGRQQGDGQPEPRCHVGDLADPDGERRTRERLLLRPEEAGRHAGEVPQTAGCGETGDVAHAGCSGSPQQWRQRHEPARSTTASFWRNADWLPCSDGKARPTQPGLQPLVARLPGDVVPGGDPSVAYANASTEGRVGRLRGYGNSVVPQVAAAFIGAYLEV